MVTVRGEAVGGVYESDVFYKINKHKHTKIRASSPPLILKKQQPPRFYTSHLSSISPVLFSWRRACVIIGVLFLLFLPTWEGMGVYISGWGKVCACVCMCVGRSGGAGGVDWFQGQLHHETQVSGGAMPPGSEKESLFFLFLITALCPV